MLRFHGHSDGKVIVPDEPVELPEARRLRITVEEIEDGPAPHSSRDVLLELARKAEEQNADLPTDLAAQHDHYLYGTPKR